MNINFILLIAAAFLFALAAARVPSSRFDYVAAGLLACVLTQLI